MFKSSNLRNLILLTILGGILGYTYYAVIGCNTGSCAIWANPTPSMAYGSGFGFLAGIFFSRDVPRKFFPW